MALATLSPTLQLDAAGPEAPLSTGQEGGRAEDSGRRRRTGCRNDPPAPDSAKVTLSLPLPIPNLPERPLVSRDGLPSPSGSGLRSPAAGTRRKVARG